MITLFRMSTPKEDYFVEQCFYRPIPGQDEMCVSSEIVGRSRGPIWHWRCEVGFVVTRENAPCCVGEVCATKTRRRDAVYEPLPSIKPRATKPTYTAKSGIPNHF